MSDRLCRVAACMSVLLIVLVVLVAGCGPRTPDPQDAGRSGMDADISDEVRFSPEQAEWINSRREEGGLTVATVELPGAFEYDENGRHEGFHGLLIRYLAEFLDMQVTVIPVDFQDFFSAGGRIPENLQSEDTAAYRPDIFDRAQILAFDISDLPWRRKIMEVHPFVKVRNLIVTRKGEEVNMLGDFQGMRFLVFSGSTHFFLLDSIRQDLGISMEITPVPFGTDRYQLLKDGQYDGTIIESGQSMKVIGEQPELSASFPLGPVLENGWAVDGNDPVLSDLLDDFIEWCRTTGRLNRAWKDTYSISIDQYEDLIDSDGQDFPELTVSESAVLESLRRDGLKAAIADSVTNWEVDESGHIRGFHYNLVLAAAHELEVPLDLIPVPFPSFFTRSGYVPPEVYTDPSFSYRPDLLTNRDLYVAAMSDLDWRRTFLKFIPLYPNRIMFVTTAGRPRPEIDQIAELRIAVMEGTSWINWLYRNLPSPPVDLIRVEDDRDLIDAVVNGRADITLYDANLILPRLPEFSGINFYPADDEVEMLSWAVDSEDPHLHSLLNKTVNFLKDNGTFDRIWFLYYGISLEEYLLLLRGGR